MDYNVRNQGDSYWPLYYDHLLKLKFTGNGYLKSHQSLSYPPPPPPPYQLSCAATVHGCMPLPPAQLATVWVMSFREVHCPEAFSWNVCKALFRSWVHTGDPIDGGAYAVVAIYAGNAVHRGQACNGCMHACLYEHVHTLICSAWMTTCVCTCQSPYSDQLADSRTCCRRDSVVESTPLDPLDWLLPLTIWTYVCTS